MSITGFDPLVDNQLEIAKMEIVGNEWQELGIAKGSSENFKKEDRRSASVKAITECQLCQLMKDDLFSICDQNTDIGYKVMKNLSKILSKKVSETNQNVLKLTTAFSLVLER